MNDEVVSRRQISGRVKPEDKRLDGLLRPQELDEFTGQERMKTNLRILIEAAQARGEPLDHILFHGPPGLGKCITGDSLVLTGAGLQTLAEIVPPDLPAGTYAACTMPVYGVHGPETTSHVYAHGRATTISVRTRLGFELEGTSNHPVLVATASGPAWKPLRDLARDDVVALACGTQLWGRTQQPAAAVMVTAAAEDARLYPGEASSLAALATTAPARLWPVPEMLDAELAYRLGLRAGTGHAQAEDSAKTIPGPILRSPAGVVRAFLQGLFDAAGAPRADGSILLATSSARLAREVQVLLANAGIMARRHLQSRGPGTSCWHLLIAGREADVFHARVDFRLANKQAHGCMEADPAPRDQIYWDRVASLRVGEAAVYDFCVPGTHSFVANGFFNHNTTLAHIVANEMNVNIRTTAGPAIERAGDLAAILTNLRAGDILFIDEVHRLGRAVEEILYPAMEDFVLDLVVGKGPGAKNVRLKLPRFTVIGATTRLALLTAPLRARFGARYRMDFYEIEAIQEIVTRGAEILQVPIDGAGAAEIATRARGTPRVALRLLRRVRDYAQVRAEGEINKEVALAALDLLQIDALGLDDLDRRVLNAIIKKFGGGPVGLDTIAASISEEADTIMDVVEPYLLQLGFLERTARGRTATPHAYEHLGLPIRESAADDQDAQPRLF